MLCVPWKWLLVLEYNIHVSAPPTKPSKVCIRLKLSSLFTIHVRAVEPLASFVTMWSKSVTAFPLGLGCPSGVGVYVFMLWSYRHVIYMYSDMHVRACTCMAFVCAGVWESEFACLGRSLEQNRRAVLWLKHQRVFQVQNGFLRAASAARF